MTTITGFENAVLESALDLDKMQNNRYYELFRDRDFDDDSDCVDSEYIHWYHDETGEIGQHEALLIRTKNLGSVEEPK